MKANLAAAKNQPPKKRWLVDDVCDTQSKKPRVAAVNVEVHDSNSSDDDDDHENDTVLARFVPAFEGGSPGTMQFQFNYVIDKV